MAGLALAVLAVWALALSVIGRAQGQRTVTDVVGTSAPGLAWPSPSDGSPASASDGSPTSVPDGSPAPTVTGATTAPDAPTSGPGATDDGGDARLRFVEFQLRLADDAPEVRDRNQALVDAARAEDDPATVAAAVAILDLVDLERDWLAGHPPAACYAEAHRAAGTMLRAYGSVADAAIAYAEARGFDRLDALAVVGSRAETAAAALRSLEQALEAATCLD